MEVITIDSKAFKELAEKIEKIAEFFFQARQQYASYGRHIWLDSDQLADMLASVPARSSVCGRIIKSHIRNFVASVYIAFLMCESQSIVVS